MNANELARNVLRLAEGAALDTRLSVDEENGLSPLIIAVNLLLDRVQHERDQLQREASVGRRVLEAATTGVVLVDSEGEVVYVNPTGRRLLKPRSEPVGKAPIISIPVAELQEVVTAALEGNEREGVECNIGRLDLEISGTSLPDGGAMVTLRDVTAVRETRRARTDFVANVSHELRTPVTAIMGYAETLLHQPSVMDEDTLWMLRKIDRNSRRLRDLFEDLLQLHRVESRRRELPLEEQAIRPILEEAVIGAADRALQRGQSFELVCSPSLTGLCNPECLTTMVANLVSNAVKYTNDDGAISVRGRVSGAEVVVEVVDTGIGIDSLHHQRIFERFYRVDAARSRALGGTGLGLALVKHLALASRSRVTVSSKEGEGSTFRIHLSATR